MSDADDRCDIEREYEEAKKTAREYLRAVGVLDPGGEGLGRAEYRATLARRSGNAGHHPEEAGRWTLLSPTIRPRVTPPIWDASTCIAVVTTKSSDALLERDRSHPAYRLALEWVVCGLLAKGADVPDRLQDGMKSRGN